MTWHTLVFLVIFMLSPVRVFADQPEYAKFKILVGSYVENMNFIDAIVQVQIPKGWHIYYKDPGDIGMPTRFIWKEDVMKAVMHWPAPIQKVDSIGESNLSSNIYEGDTFFPVRIYLKMLNAKQRINIIGHVEYSICKDVCIPRDNDIQLIIDDIYALKQNPEVTAMISSWLGK